MSLHLSIIKLENSYEISRRAFATRLFALGTDINIVKEAMGHASVSTTQRYDMRGVEVVMSTATL